MQPNYSQSTLILPIAEIQVNTSCFENDTGKWPSVKLRQFEGSPHCQSSSLFWNRNNDKEEGKILTVGHPTIIGQDGLGQDLGEKDGAAAGQG